ncbi:PilN family type IVB pilus formation outer membrane protein [Yersinia pseudotuberculosis]|uniref:PilN family type IVB pilus formation outer membrane protein n=1 Tax=Yersinia pseudotuberculosis TaxID=633 RepID=UPI001A9F315E|nr:PilN family type IVB pilus formation outer membrane protein [Yersinia pseudotuberculosis]MBO1566686.1 PilN family type IVB pilus formation outer membrane protein [Yersinia pseudotuberculosis]MBO1603545.1 PilN family type IVB pilus formation outer membrane protein [Yersinia pseudotuberculosis]
MHWYSVARTSRLIGVVLSLKFLIGCSLSEIDRIESLAKDSGETARRITDSNGAKTQPSVTWADKPWVNLKPLTPAAASPEEKMLLPCQITINRPEGMSLPELGQRITRLCGARVTITPDAFLALSSANASFAMMPSGKHINALKWQGDLPGLLDTIGSRLGLSWRTDKGNIVFYQLDTRTFQLVILNTKISSSASVTSGSSSSMGSSGGANSGVSGDSNSVQKTSVDLNSNLYEDIKKTIENMLTPSKGRFWLSSASGTLTVTDTPETLERIGRYIDHQNELLNRQVQLNVQVLSVTQSRKEQFGLDWKLVYQSLNNIGASVTGNLINAANNTLSGGLSILGTATGPAEKFSGSELLIKALSQQGNVSLVTELNRATINLTPVPFQISDQTGYIQSSSTTVTANAGTTSSMQTGIITTGLFMSMLPYIQENGDVQIQFAFTLSDKPIIQPFFSRDGNTRNDTPAFKLRSLTQTVNLRAGQTLVLTGADQLDTVANKQGAFTPSNFWWGGGHNGLETRTTLVILITPVLLR